MPDHAAEPGTFHRRILLRLPPGGDYDLIEIVPSGTRPSPAPVWIVLLPVALGADLVDVALFVPNTLLEVLGLG